MNPNSLKPLRSLLIIFGVLTLAFAAGSSLLRSWKIDPWVLGAGNLLVFLTVLVSFLLLRRAMHSPNPQSFVRAMYGSFLVKFFVLALAAFIYIMVTRKEVNKPALFGSIALYFMYTFIEINTLLRMLKRQKNA